MDWLTDEILFYGGAITGGCAIILGGIYFCISRIKLARLNAQLDSEYGKREKK